MKILLTGDDGYKAPGLRLLVKLLKDEHNLFIATTYDQQSGVGGVIHMKEDLRWDIFELDGVQGLRTGGSPCDALEILKWYLPENTKFDLIISGINWGPNIGSANISSGTVAAVIRAMGLNLVEKGLGFSWDLPKEVYFIDHDEQHEIDTYLKYPGQAITQIIKIALAESFWGARILNINFPAEPSTKLIFTYPNVLINDVWQHKFRKNSETKGIFNYKMLGSRVKGTKGDLLLDNVALDQGNITISPLSINLLDQDIYKHVQGQSIDLT